jgi:hypothetical protein
MRILFLEYEIVPDLFLFLRFTCILVLFYSDYQSWNGAVKDG